MTSDRNGILRRISENLSQKILRCFDINILYDTLKYLKIIPSPSCKTKIFAFEFRLLLIRTIMIICDTVI